MINKTLQDASIGKINPGTNIDKFMRNTNEINNTKYV
jgi:hypothetical protein